MARRKGIDCSLEDGAIKAALNRYGIKDAGFIGVNVYCYNVTLPIKHGDEKAAAFATDVFHAVNALDKDCKISVGQSTDYCFLDRDDERGCYGVIFNHHDIVGSKPGDELYAYSVAAILGEDGEEDDEAWMQELAEGIKSGKIRSKSGEGFFVLKGEFFDAIKDGRKTTEYRDITPRNLSKSIGIKTVKLQRGYGHPGKPPEQMRFEVKSVGFLDADDRECDPYDIPGGFIATTIAIHLGKRIE